MKFTVAISALFAVAFADIAQMGDDFDKNSGDRGFGSMSGTVAAINGLGCWCFLGDYHGQGKGTPLNPIDELCKSLHNGYECAMRDAEDEGASCTPWEVTYNSAVGGITTSLTDGCTAANNGNNCAIRACILEGTFVEGLLDFFVLQNGSISVFQAPFNCPVNNVGGPSPKQCCGTYPDRFPYKTNNGDRGCCGQRTYNTQTLTCCDESTSSVKFNC